MHLSRYCLVALSNQDIKVFLELAIESVLTQSERVFFFFFIQAFLLKNILFNRESSNWRQLPGRLLVGEKNIQATNFGVTYVVLLRFHFN